MIHTMNPCPSFFILKKSLPPILDWKINYARSLKILTRALFDYLSRKWISYEPFQLPNCYRDIKRPMLTGSLDNLPQNPYFNQGVGQKDHDHYLQQIMSYLEPPTLVIFWPGPKKYNFKVIQGIKDILYYLKPWE